MRAPSPIAFSIMGYDFMWYGLLIGLGVVLAVILSYQRANRHGIEPERILDLEIWILPIGVIGARLYYVIFNWDYYSQDFMTILNIRGGGLAIHGGIIAGAITGYLLCKHYKINFLEILDLFLPAVSLAQSR